MPTKNEIHQHDAQSYHYQINPEDYVAILNGKAKKLSSNSLAFLPVKKPALNMTKSYQKQELVRHKSTLLMGLLGITVACSFFFYTLTAKKQSIILLTPSHVQYSMSEQNTAQDNMAIKYALAMSYEIVKAINADSQDMNTEFTNQFTSEGLRQYLIEKNKGNKYRLSAKEMTDLTLITYSGVNIQTTEHTQSYQINIQFKAKDKLMTMNLNVLKNKETKGKGFIINGIN